MVSGLMLVNSCSGERSEMPHSLTNAKLPNVVIAGTGVVGQAILKAHTDANVSVCVYDQNVDRIHQAINQLDLDQSSWSIQSERLSDLDVVAVCNTAETSQPERSLIIESIPEQLELKQTFFGQMESAFDNETILCTNTSTLEVSRIAESLQRPQRMCGMHFFMPVDKRNAVEIVQAAETQAATVEYCKSHVNRLGKSPLVARDRPGFIVNRLLSPYLNQALLLLTHGVDADRIERAAKAYGMPLSPLELIDLIGMRTTFDAGKSFWQAYPKRFDPSPIAAAMLKRKRFGVCESAGLYDYESGLRSTTLASETQEVVQRYFKQQIDIDDDELNLLLALPMWIEATVASEERVFQSGRDLELAMSGGLGFDNTSGWVGYFRNQGVDKLQSTADKWSTVFRTLNPTAEFDWGVLLNAVDSQSITPLRFAG